MTTPEDAELAALVLAEARARKANTDESTADSFEAWNDASFALWAAAQKRLNDIRCAVSGGRGIGAGHECFCVRRAPHAEDHGCSCGAVWATPERLDAEGDTP